MIFILVGCIALFSGASLSSAVIGTKGQSVIVKFRRTLFLMGVSGTVTVLFFALTSWGRIFLFGPAPTVLLVVFAFMALSSRLGTMVEGDTK